MENDCDKGYRGDCCCNCKLQVEINCHPSNNEPEISKGSINDHFAWGCSVLIKLQEKGFENTIIFSDRKHGMCEMHHRK